VARAREGGGIRKERRIPKGSDFCNLCVSRGGWAWGKSLREVESGSEDSGRKPRAEKEEWIPNPLGEKNQGSTFGGESFLPRKSPVPESP